MSRISPARGTCGTRRVANAVPDRRRRSGPWSEPAGDTHDGAVGEGADLDQVAQLVGQPQAPAPALLTRRGAPPDEGVVDASPVAHLAHDAVGLAPHPQH